MKFGPENLGEPPLGGAAPQIHLEEPVLRLHESLREKQIVLGRRLDMRNAPRVADDAHRCREAVEFERPGYRRHDRLRHHRCRGSLTGGHDEGAEAEGEQSKYDYRAWRSKRRLLAEYDHEMGTTRKLLERLPDDKLAWKPHEKSMALGELASHLGNIPNWGGHDSE